MENTFKYLGSNSSEASAQKDDAAQKFLDDKLAKNRFTQKQQETLDANGGPTVANASEGFLAKAKADADVTSTPKSTVTGGGTGRYADYDNTNGGETQFSDAWVEGAKYQQLRGSGKLTNKDFDAQFASAKGGADTGTVADDGGGWKLIKQDEGEKTNERKLEYKDVAAQWQAAGYDVRVQDHNPDFEGGTGEIAVRVSGSKTPEKERTPIEHSPEIKQATERVKSYENDILSGKTSEDIYGSGSNYSFDASKGAAGIGTPMNGDSAQQANKATASFLDNKKAQVKDKYQFQAQG